jgi:hypothetical protein
MTGSPPMKEHMNKPQSLDAANEFRLTVKGSNETGNVHKI